MNACTDLNFSQWEHIMHHQFIPIGEVGIYMQYIHHLRVCANTYTCNRSNGNASCIASRSPSERWASIRMQYIWVCVLLTHTCVLTHTYTRVQLSCICDNKRQLQYTHQRKIGGRLVRREARLGGVVRTSLLVQYRVDCIAHGDHYLTYIIRRKRSTNS